MEKVSILYVDDEPLNLQLFKLNFRKVFDLHLAQSASEGLDIFKSNEICIVISDFKMPEMNGIDFIRKVRELQPETTCFLLSAYIESEIKEMVIEDGIVDEYMAKPWKREDILEIIQQYHKNC